MKDLRLAAGTVLLGVLWCTPVLSQTYVMGMQAYQFSRDPMPAKAGQWANQPFTYPVTRISDQAADGYPREMMRNFYAKHDHENADGSLVMLHDGARWFLYNTVDWSCIRELPGRISGWTEPRWDPVDPSVFYFVEQMQFYSFDIDDDSSQLLHDFSSEFPSASKIWNEHEGDSSLDARYWAFKVVGSNQVICYDKQQDQVVGTWTDPDANWVGMSMSGDYVVLGTQPFTFLQRGTQNSTTAVAGAWGHADLALDAQGRDIIFYMNNSHDWYSYTYLDTGEEVRMYHVEEWGFGAHMSGNASGVAPGWGLVSTFYRGADNWDTWQPSYWMYNAIYMVEFSATPRIWRIAHTMTASETYWDDTMATINRSGTRVYWGSNWMDPQNRVDAYVVELPANWYQDLSGAAFDAGPQPDAITADATMLVDSSGAVDASTHDGGAAPDSGARDISAEDVQCTPICLDQNTLQNCDGVVLPCGQAQQCQQGLCLDHKQTDKDEPAQNNGCTCTSASSTPGLLWSGLVLLGWRRRKQGVLLF